MDHHGRILSDSQVKDMDLMEQRKQQALNSAKRDFIKKNIDFQTGRQLELQKQLNAIEKISAYRRVKVRICFCLFNRIIG